MNERLQKIISAAGLMSRRAAEESISQGRVTVNGVTANPGDKADIDRDIILIDGIRVMPSSEKVYIMLNKPKNYVTTLSDEKDRKTVADLVKDLGVRVYPVGRLDKDSEGLILMTNQGDLVNKMMRSGNNHEKEYLVSVDKPIHEAFLKGMAAPVYLKELDVTTKPCVVEQTGKCSFRIILTQGYNRQIRRMCETFGFKVTKLKRIRIMNIHLDDLKVGAYREVTPKEMKQLLELIKDSSSETVRK